MRRVHLELHEGVEVVCGGHMFILRWTGVPEEGFYLRLLAATEGYELATRGLGPNLHPASNMVKLSTPGIHVSPVPVQA